MPYPARVSLRVKSGAMFRRVYTWKAAGVPVDLTGWTARVEVYDCDGSLVHTLSTSPAVGDGTITLGGAAGTITLASAGLSANPVATYEFDLQLTDPAGEVTYLLEGTIDVTPSYTTT